MSKSREQLQKYLSEIDIIDKVVLDAGSGSREHWARNWTRGEPEEYITLDSEEFPDVTIVTDLNEEGIYKESDNFDSQNFDIIFCLETLEHLWNPIEALRTFMRVLKPNGKAYFSTPLINPYHDTVDYARYTDEWYQKVLTEVGFKDIKIKPRVATDGLPRLLDFYKAEGLRMSKMRAGQEEKTAWVGFFVEATK